MIASTKVKTFPWLYDGDLTLIPLALSHVELLRRWRNRDDIRRWFFTQDVISAEQQLDWFRNVYQHDLTDQMWIAHLNGVPVGTGALTHIDFGKREAEWSRLIVGEDVARGRGVAGRICRLVRDYGLDTLKLERIYGSLYTTNEVTMHIDNAAGYMPCQVDGDVTHVELWRRDWR